MQAAITEFEQKFKKPQIGNIRSGDSVRVHQVISEGGKKRTQVFEGLVIRTSRMNSVTATILVRRIASGIGVEKSFLLHSPTVIKVDVVRRSKVRRNYLSYMRGRGGKSARLSEVSVDKAGASMEEAAEEKQDAASNKQGAETKEATNLEPRDKSQKASQTEDASTKAEAKVQKNAGQEAKATSESTEKPEAEDKANDKKAKAEAFRKAQEAKKK